MALLLSLYAIYALSGVNAALLVGFPGWKHTPRLTLQLIPVLAGIVVLLVLLPHLGEFLRLQMAATVHVGVKEVEAVYVGPSWTGVPSWVCIVASDLWGNSWMGRDARQHKLPHGLMAVLYIVAPLLGPIVFGAYVVIRWAMRRGAPIDA